MVGAHSSRYTISENEAVEAAKFTAMKRLFSRPLLPIFVVLLVIFAILSIANGEKQWMVFALALALASPIALFVVVWWLIPLQAKRHYSQAVALADEISLEWDDGGIGYSSAHGNSRFGWSDYHGWAETGQLLILYQSENFYNIIPKRVFDPSVQEAFKRRLRDAKVNEV